MFNGLSHYAIIAGLCAAAGSFFGKLPSIIIIIKNNTNTINEGTFNTDILSSSSVNINDGADDDNDDAVAFETVFNEQITIWLLKIICLMLMIIFNAMVWTFFVKALHDKGGSLVATVTSAATNYCTSAFLGYLIFKEKTSTAWWFGTIFVIIGLLFMSMEALDDNDNDAKKKFKIENINIKQKNKLKIK